MNIVEYPVDIEPANIDDTKEEIIDTVVFV